MQRDKRIELLLSAVLHDALLFCEIVTNVEGEAFYQNEYNNFLIQLKSYYKQYKCCPTREELRIFINSNEIWNQFIFINDVFEDNPDIDREIARKVFYKHYQKQQVNILLDIVSDRIELGQLDIKDFHGQVQEVVRKTSEPDKNYTVLTAQNIAGIYREARDIRIEKTEPLIFKIISRILGGGISRGELLIFIAASNRGKTLYLINELYNALLSGEKVLYLSMENEALSITARLSDRILLMDKLQQRRKELISVNFLEKFFRYCGEPVIVYKPANSFSIDDLDLWLEEYQLKNKVVFDKVIVDYIDKFKKMKVHKGSATHEDDRKLADDLRAMAIKRQLRVITAAQTTREGIDTGDKETHTVRETMMQGGFGKYETADIVLAYSETLKEKQKGLGRITGVKFRDTGGRGREFIVTVAPWLGLMTDCVDDIIPPWLKKVLENPDRKYGMLTGLTVVPEGTGRKHGGAGKAPPVANLEADKKKLTDVKGVTV